MLCMCPVAPVLEGYLFQSNKYIYIYIIIATIILIVLGINVYVYANGYKYTISVKQETNIIRKFHEFQTTNTNMGRLLNNPG